MAMAAQMHHDHTHGPHKTRYFIYHLKPNSHHHKPTKSIGKTQQPPPQTHEINWKNPTVTTTNPWILSTKINSHHGTTTNPQYFSKNQQPPPQTHEIYRQNPTPAIAMAKHSNTIGPDRHRLTRGSWRPDWHCLTRGSWRPDRHRLTCGSWRPDRHRLTCGSWRPDQIGEGEKAVSREEQCFRNKK